MGMRDNLMTRQGLILGLLVAVTQYICITTTILALDDFFFFKKIYQQPPPGFDEVNAFFGEVVGACGDMVDQTRTHHLWGNFRKLIKG